MPKLVNLSINNVGVQKKEILLQIKNYKYKFLQALQIDT